MWSEQQGVDEGREDSTVHFCVLYGSSVQSLYTPGWHRKSEFRTLLAAEQVFGHAFKKAWFKLASLLAARRQLSRLDCSTYHWERSSTITSTTCYLGESASAWSSYKNTQEKQNCNAMRYKRRPRSKILPKEPGLRFFTFTMWNIEKNEKWQKPFPKTR